MAGLDNKIDLMGLFNSALNEFETTYNTIKERGPKYFWRPLVIAGGGVALTYYLFFLPPGLKLAKLTEEFNSVQTSLTYADRYTEIRDKLLAIYPQLPVLKDREQWLAETLIQTMKTRRITAQSMKPPRELTKDGLAFQTLQIDVTLSYKDLVRWVKTIEKESPILHIDNLMISKKVDALGITKTTAKLSTIVVVRRLAP